MFERLTNYDYVAGIKVGDLKTGINQEKAFDRLAQYEDSGLSPEEVMQLQTAYKAIPKGVTGEPIYTTCFGIPLSEIEEWVRAKADGRLVVLPCKVGDILELMVMGTAQKYRFMGIIQQEGYLPSLYGRQLFGKFQDVSIAMVESFGKTVFLSREAAEKALGGGDIGKDDLMTKMGEIAYGDTCNTTKLPCAECNPVCEHRAKS